MRSKCVQSRILEAFTTIFKNKSNQVFKEIYEFLTVTVVCIFDNKDGKPTKTL